MKVHYLGVFLVSICCAIILLVPVKLLAHAVLVESAPQAGSKIRGPEVSIRLKFNVRIDGGRSRCTLVTPDGQTRVVSLEPQSKPDVLTGSAAQLRTGNYTMQWQVLAADGHISRGEFTFNVE